MCEMRNMKYFCTVKRVIHIFALAIICLISLTCSEIHASIPGARPDVDNDSVKISLLTCAPGGEVYSLYGHTAIRYTDYNKGIDVAINYGVFSFSQPFFVLRFIFGRTDYEMGIVPFDYFRMEYENEGRPVYQQELNLSAKEKAAIRDAIDNNYLPQNRVYRYNYFYDNCTTRARDILVNNIEGHVSFPGDGQVYPSYREMIHSFNGDSPWARFGKDILLGVKADQKTTLSERQFLPFNLKDDFDKATIIRKDGTARPLVKQSTCITDCPQLQSESGFPLRPSTCAWIIFAVVAAMTLLEIATRKRLWVLDTILMVFDGCVGMLIFLMFFSELPATNTNLQILLFNPLPLFFAYSVAKKAAKNKPTRFWPLSAAVLAVFFICGFFQQYAEGMYVLASSLLLRCVWNTVRQTKHCKINK